MSEAGHRKGMRKRVVGESRFDAAGGEEREFVCTGGKLAFSGRSGELARMIVGYSILIAVCGFEAFDRDCESIIGAIRQQVCFPCSFPSIVGDIVIRSCCIPIGDEDRQLSGIGLPYKETRCGV